MALAKILIVDDDPAIRNLVYRFLAKQNYEMESAADGETAMVVFERFNPDLVILDVNLPDTLGFHLCKQMQDRTGVYVIMLTSRSDVDDKRRGLGGGADDYLTKPFDLEELKLRVEALLRRKRVVTVPERQSLVFKGLGFAFEQLVIDPVGRKVSTDDQLLVLTALEFDLLHFLAGNPGRVWRREELIQKVWGDDYVGDVRKVDVHIGQIRRKMKLKTDPDELIVTIRGVGYKFEVPNSANG